MQRLMQRLMQRDGEREDQQRESLCWGSALPGDLG